MISIIHCCDTINMAILSNGKFYGFLCSVKATGQKLANGVKEYVEDFMSGFAGHGWKLWEYMTGKWKLEIDTIVVRETMIVFEMLISKIRAIIGAQTISQGHGKVKSARISDDGTEYLIELEDEDVSIVAHDFVRCQTFVGDKTKLYHVEVSSVDVETKTLHVPLSEFDKDESGNVLNVPAAGDELVQFGNSQNKARQSAIYMHADETGQPAIDVMFDLDSKNWEGKVKVRMGGDIPGGNGLKGFYSVNGMVKAVDDKGAVIYELSPDGSVNLGKGNIVYSPSTNKVTLGSGVTLTWNNLDNESKENLKGEPGKDGADGKNGQDGKDGYNGIDGADGINGKDGASLVYKGEYSSHPSNPQNGWYYRNTTDKKCYVYQDNSWYVMTVDGSDGKNGMDGVNGEDGKDGLDIVWKGDSSTPPSNPQKNWVYRDTDNGRVYIYNGLAWELMVADGNDGTDGTNGIDGTPGADGEPGKDGMRVYITYHDSETEPAVPTGNGTTEGWHTNSTASVVWISQKVADSADSGEWGTPIRFRGKDGQDANLLPWIEEWNNNKTEIGGEYMVSPKMFSGTKDSNGKLTGVAMGRDCLTGADGTKRTGIFALVDDEVVFELDPVNKKYKFKGEVFANKGTFTGTVNANDGVIGGFEIEGSGLKNISGRDAMISVQTNYGDHQRQAALGNTLSAMVGFDVSAYMSATGNWNSFNRALMLRASGSTMRKDMMFGGYCNLCIDAIGGVDWKMDKNDHWSMPGVLGFVAVERDLNSVQRWGDGMIISRIQRTSTGQYTLYHSQGHTDYIVIVQTTPWAVDGDRWTIGIECGRYNDHFNIQTLDANKGLMNIDFRVVVIGRPAD